MNYVKSFLRTSGAFLLCILMILFSGKIFNFLNGFFQIIAITSYYYGAMYFYSLISSDGNISIAIGALVSILFIGLYVWNIFYDIGWVMRIFFIIGTLTGIGSTFTFLPYKATHRRTEGERGGILS